MTDNHAVDPAVVLKWFAGELVNFSNNVSRSIKAYVDEGKELKTSTTGAAGARKRKGKGEVRTT